MKTGELIRGFRSYYHSLKRRRNIVSMRGHRADELYELVHRSSPVFVLSTGRCGTMFLSDVLMATGQAEVFHEPEVELIYHSARAYRLGKEGIEAMKLLADGARYEMVRNAWLNNKKYIETNNRITFFAWPLADIFPNARFIHLVRHPHAFVRSGMGRGWYTGRHLHDEGRICDIQNPGWDELPQWKKIAWLWQATNAFIEAFRKTHADRCHFIRSEELFTDKKKLCALIQFCGLTAPVDEKLNRLMQKKVNVQTGSVDLNEGQKEAIDKWVPLAAQYGY